MPRDEHDLLAGDAERAAAPSSSGRESSSRRSRGTSGRPGRWRSRWRSERAVRVSVAHGSVSEFWLSVGCVIVGALGSQRDDCRRRRSSLCESVRYCQQLVDLVDDLRRRRTACLGPCSGRWRRPGTWPRMSMPQLAEVQLGNQHLLVALQDLAEVRGERVQVAQMGVGDRPAVRVRSLRTAVAHAP